MSAREECTGRCDVTKHRPVTTNPATCPETSQKLSTEARVLGACNKVKIETTRISVRSEDPRDVVDPLERNLVERLNSWRS